MLVTVAAFQLKPALQRHADTAKRLGVTARFAKVIADDDAFRWGGLVFHQKIGQAGKHRLGVENVAF